MMALGAFFSRLYASQKQFLLKNPPGLFKPSFLRTSFTRDIFLKSYHRHLGLRKKSFLMFFEILEKKPEKNFSIVETGTSRKILTNIRDDGASTFLFDAFVRYYGGSMISIDLDDEACRKVQSQVSIKTRVLSGDSLKHLQDIQDPLDAVYLDSMDLDFLKPQVSAEHHLKEFKIIDSKIRPGGLLMIDDCPTQGHWPQWIHGYLKERGLKLDDIPFPNGKGYLVDNYLQSLGTYVKLFHEYQALYQKIGENAR